MVAPILLAILISGAPLNTTASVPEQQPPAAEEKPEEPWPPAGVFRSGPEVTTPKLIKETRPNLAAGAKVQGTVILEAVVLTDGAVGEVRVVRSLDKQHGLDDEAVKTVKKWRFTPGKKDGIAVPVIVSVEMTFTRR
jgi:periplasmic protein TonB